MVMKGACANTTHGAGIDYIAVPHDSDRHRGIDSRGRAYCPAIMARGRTRQINKEQ